MCIIVDANAARDLSAPTDDGKPVLDWLLKGKGALIVGGRLKTELSRSGLRSTLVVWDQAGRLRKFDDTKVLEVSTHIDARRICCSNDCHVIALAIVSRCRLIFTKDKNLHKDIKNKEILNPTASVYKSKKHKHLLRECHCI
jgi:predicted nucleic acid-binding protein